MAAKSKTAEFVRWMGPLLDVLRELGGSASPREASDTIADKLKLSDEIRNATTKSGQERFHNQVQWARQYLVWEGLLDASRRGVWALTPMGRASHLTDLEAHALFLKWVKLHAEKREQAQPQPSKNEDLVVEPLALDDRDDLLFVLGNLPPKGFERICQRLLRESGFEKVEITGRTGDGGIDGVGVLQINPLVSFSVVFQCKKWSGSVPSKEIRDFRGAMDGRAEKGIFITTSTFTADARKEAERPGATPIELVDGEKLVEMFERLELGLTPEVVYRVDHAFFDAFREEK